jgi:hypothetical protein
LTYPKKWAVGKGQLAKGSWQDAKEQYGGNKVRIMAGSFRDLTVYKKAFALAMKIFEITKKFPS